MSPSSSGGTSQGSAVPSCGRRGQSLLCSWEGVSPSVTALGGAGDCCLLLERLAKPCWKVWEWIMLDGWDVCELLPWQSFTFRGESPAHSRRLELDDLKGPFQPKPSRHSAISAHLHPPHPNTTKTSQSRGRATPGGSSSAYLWQQGLPVLEPAVGGLGAAAGAALPGHSLLDGHAHVADPLGPAGLGCKESREGSLGRNSVLPNGCSFPW